jgi:lathosterol oxidase
MTSATSPGALLLEFLIRSVISGTIACAIYVVAAGVVARTFSRPVARDILRHDIRLGFTSLLVGSPILQGFSMAHELWGISKVYPTIGEHGWLYWLVSIPLYVLLWDLTFYLTHLVLHWPSVYRSSHYKHHACRPPVAWSGIAIDPLETLLSGIAPYLVPLFVLPFHVYTVYALNMALMVWATLLHSSMPWHGNGIFLGPRDHNVHHAHGLRNVNFAAVFTFWDRIGGTMSREDPPWWGMTTVWRPRGAKREDG